MVMCETTEILHKIMFHVPTQPSLDSREAKNRKRLPIPGCKSMFHLERWIRITLVITELFPLSGKNLGKNINEPFLLF